MSPPPCWGGDLGVSSRSCASRLLSCPPVVCLAEVGSEHPSSPSSSSCCTLAPGGLSHLVPATLLSLCPPGDQYGLVWGKQRDAETLVPIFGFSLFHFSSFFGVSGSTPALHQKGECCECLLGAPSADVPQLQKALPKLVSLASAPQSEVPKGAAKLRTWTGASSSSFQ